MIAFLSAAILMVIAVFLYVKRHKDCNRIKILDVLICVFLTIGAFLFVIIFDTGTITVKYFGAIFYVTAAFLQNIKTICSLKVKK